MRMAGSSMFITLMLSNTVLISLLCCCEAHKLLLFFPIPSRSHAILGEAYVKHLTNAGHEVTYVTPLPMKTPPKGVRQIDISENIKLMTFDDIFDAKNLMSDNPVDLQNTGELFKVFVFFANGTLHIGELQKLLGDPNEEFHAVIVEWLYTEIFSGLAAVFNCPLIWSSSMEPHSMVLSLIDQYPNPSYTLHNLSRHRKFTFWDRVEQLWMTIDLLLKKWRMHSYDEQVYTNIFEKFVTKRGRLLPGYEEMRLNSSLMLGNSYIASGEAISLPQSYKAIGGYHIEKDIKPLPEHLQKIMDEAKQGVIYFSMGSMLRSSRIPENIRRDLLNIFGALNQTVLWKFEEVLPDLPKNVHILHWAPQTSILGHSNCVLFITHGGLLSQIEALHFGVPMIGIPLYADQFLNIDRAEYKGFAKRVDLHHQGSKKLDLAIREILGNSSYQERAKAFSFIHHHRPVPPEKELVHWVEHVIQTRGALHLRSPALLMPWYQKYYIDLATVILSLVVTILILFRRLRATTTYVKEKMT